MLFLYLFLKDNMICNFLITEVNGIFIHKLYFEMYL